MIDKLRLKTTKQTYRVHVHDADQSGYQILVASMQVQQIEEILRTLSMKYDYLEGYDPDNPYAQATFKFSARIDPKVLADNLDAVDATAPYADEDRSLRGIFLNQVETLTRSNEGSETS